MRENVNSKGLGEEGLLFLTDDRLRSGIEAIFFAYWEFARDSDQALKQCKYGRAHHRALHFINRRPGISVTDLGAILGISKQSLNRVLRALVQDGLVESRAGPDDRRMRSLELTPLGRKLEGEISEVQHSRMRAAYRAAGPEAVSGFRSVLKHIAGSRAEALRKCGEDCR